MSRHLLNTGEVAARLGVTRPRVSQLVAEHEAFPEPVAHTLIGDRVMKLWEADDISAFDVTYDRTPGPVPGRGVKQRNA